MAKDTTLLVATVKNEGPGILEWVAHHRLCGFDRIQIYQNDSFDTTLPILRTLDRLGVIEFHNNRHAKGAFQTRAYKRAARTETYASSDWCMVLDGDEFLAVKSGDNSVENLVRAAYGADAMLINWRLFGSAGATELTGDLVTERFTMAEPKSDILSAKTPHRVLFRTDAFERPEIAGPVDPKRGDLRLINASGLAEDAFDQHGVSSTDPGQRTLAQVNHYAVRDLQSFLMKRARGPANGQGPNIDHMYWALHNRNDESDRLLADRAHAVRAEMQHLDDMSDGKLMRLRQRAIRQWRQTAKIRTQEADYAKLIEAIQSAGNEATMETAFKLPKRNAPVFRSVRSQVSDWEPPVIGWAAE